MFFQGGDGRFRRAAAGEAVDVHADDLARFDEYNRLPGDPVEETKPAVEKKTSTRRKASE